MFIIQNIAPKPSKTHIRFQTAYGIFGKVAVETKVVKRLEIAVKPAIIDNGFCLKIIDIGMTAKLTKSKSVYINLIESGIAEDEITKRRLRKAVDLE